MTWSGFRRISPNLSYPHPTRPTLHILAAVAEHEREMIAERTKSALRAAKARGVRLGRNGADRLAPAYRAARFSLTNWNPSVGSHPSPGRTRPRLLRGSRAPQTVTLLAPTVVGLSSRRPSSRSACATQLRIACAEGSNSFASCSGVRPARISSIICRRNSGA